MSPKTFFLLALAALVIYELIVRPLLVDED